MRYSRFLWPNLLAIQREIAAGVTPYHLARYVWRVGRLVIVRAQALMSRLAFWVEALHQEIFDGRAVRELALMVKFITLHLGRLELLQRWYRHRYPLRSG